MTEIHNKSRADAISVNKGSGSMLPLCRMCNEMKSKYRCPRCLMHTCSLQCCKEHKAKFNCSGKRDRTNYIPLSKFTDSNVLSDYFLLHEVSRNTENGPRKRLRMGIKPFLSKPKRRKKVFAEGELNVSSCLNPEFPCDWLSRYPLACQRLVEKARNNGVDLNLMAPGMTKRKNNSSYYNTKEDKLMWRLEINFVSAEVQFLLVEKAVNDETVLRGLIEKYLSNESKNAITRSKLSPYLVDNINRLNILFRLEGANIPMYYRLNIDQSLQSNLSGKKVVEYPIFLMVLPHDIGNYKIVPNKIEEISMAPT